MRTGEFEKVGEILPRFINSIKGKKKYKEQLMMFHWREIIGSDMAKHVRPDRFSFSTLFLSVSSPVWSSQLYYLKEEIIEKINKFIGERLVKEIRFNSSTEPFKRALYEEERQEEKYIAPEPCALELERAKKVCEDIEDDELKNAAQKAFAASLVLYRERVASGWKKCRSCGKLTEPKEKICESCRQRKRRNAEFKIIKLLKECPWIKYSDIAKSIECTPEEANAARAKLSQIWGRKIVFGDTKSLEAKAFVMLVAGIPPDALTEDKINRVMKRFRWMLINPAESEKNTEETKNERRKN